MHIQIRRSLPEDPENKPPDAAQRPVRASGVIGRVLSLFRPDFAALCPDLVREARMAASRAP